MIDFRLLYQQQLVAMRLSRAAAVAYAMNGCNGSPTENITTDLTWNVVAVDDTSTPSGLDARGLCERANPTVGEKSGEPGQRRARRRGARWRQDCDAYAVGRRVRGLAQDGDVQGEREEHFVHDLRRAP